MIQATIKVVLLFGLMLSAITAGAGCDAVMWVCYKTCGGDESCKHLCNAAEHECVVKYSRLIPVGAIGPKERVARVREIQKAVLSGRDQKYALRLAQADRGSLADAVFAAGYAGDLQLVKDLLSLPVPKLPEAKDIEHGPDEAFYDPEYFPKFLAARALQAAIESGQTQVVAYAINNLNVDMRLHVPVQMLIPPGNSAFINFNCVARLFGKSELEAYLNTRANGGFDSCGNFPLQETQKYRGLMIDALAAAVESGSAVPVQVLQLATLRSAASANRDSPPPPSKSASAQGVPSTTTTASSTGASGTQAVPSGGTDAPSARPSASNSSCPATGAGLAVRLPNYPNNAQLVQIRSQILSTNFRDSWSQFLAQGISADDILRRTVQQRQQAQLAEVEAKKAYLAYSAGGDVNSEVAALRNGSASVPNDAQSGNSAGQLAMAYVAAYYVDVAMGETLKAFQCIANGQ